MKEKTFENCENLQGLIEKSFVSNLIFLTEQ